MAICIPGGQNPTVPRLPPFRIRSKKDVLKKTSTRRGMRVASVAEEGSCRVV